DFAIRSQHAAFRWATSGIGAAAALWCALRFVWPTLQYRTGRLATTRRIESRFPVLGERLSNAVAFLEPKPADMAGISPSLRQAIIRDAERASADLEFGSILNNAPLRNAAWLAGVCLTAAALLTVANPAAAGFAIRRISAPWRELAWPRWHEL